MLKPTNSEASFVAILAAVAITLAALLVYVFLLRHWQTPAVTPTPAVQTKLAADQAPLVLSRRLSNVEPGTTPGDVTFAGTTPSLFGPLLGFFLALGAGALAGRMLWRQADAEPVVATTPPSEPIATASIDDKADPNPPVAVSTAQASDTHTMADPDGALRARDNVIASLEGIVSENRETWSDFEREREALRSTIARLEADLAASNTIIEDMHRDSRRSQQLAEEHGAVGHQVMQRG